MKIKVKYQQRKRNRIKRFCRSRLEMINGNWFSDDRKYFLRFKYKGKNILIDNKIEEEKLLNGQLCHTVCSEGDEFKSTSMIFNIKTVKSALRFIRKLGKFLPDGTLFEDFGGWIGYKVTFELKNTGYSEEKIKDKYYKDLTLLPKYTRLSGIKYFDNIVKKIRDRGYFVSVEYNKPYTYLDGTVSDGYWSAYIHGKGIVAMFCEENNQSYSCLSKQICIDRYDNFNKWSQAEYQLALPKNKKDFDDLFKLFEKIGLRNL